jgi:hypothetical protein
MAACAKADPVEDNAAMAPRDAVITVLRFIMAGLSSDCAPPA